MKRWTALAASILMQTCLGMVYAWSTFVPALEHEHGVTPGRAGLIFGVCIAVFTASMVFAGQLQQRYGPRRIGMTGGALFLLGYLIGSAPTAGFAVMLLGFGVLAGAGIGFAYVCPLATGVKWFPHHKGLITGLAVAGFGLGGVFFASAGQQMIDAALPVLAILRRIGWTVGLTVIGCAGLLFVPRTVSGSTAEEPARQTICSILAQRPFRILFLQMFCGTFGGLLIIGNLKPIGLVNGLTPEAATLAVMLFAVGNAAGRVLWGVWYDRFGTAVIRLCLLLLAAGAAVMGLFPARLAFYTAALLTAFAFGGCFVLFAARVADQFGNDRISDIYPFVFLGYGIAGLAGPPAGGWLLARSGAPLLPGLIVTALALAGIAAGIQRKQNTHKEPDAQRADQFKP
jgi:OFA family oxalate/formate antiporter-like MFS transporter